MLLDSAGPHIRPSGGAPIDLNALVQPSLGAIIVGLSIVVIVLTVVVIVLARRVRRIDDRLLGLTRGEEGDSLEAVLHSHLEKVDVVARGLGDLGGRIASLEGAQRRSFQRVGLVRYNPFEETGGNQSFALVLLDADGNGWVLSSLHARTGTRVYAKAVTAGRADGTLSDEENDALSQALA